MNKETIFALGLGSSAIIGTMAASVLAPSAQDVFADRIEAVADEVEKLLDSGQITKDELSRAMMVGQMSRAQRRAYMSNGNKKRGTR